MKHKLKLLHSDLYVLAYIHNFNMFLLLSHKLQQLDGSWQRGTA